jgi:hypothetical protein
MSYTSRRALLRAIHRAVRYNREMPVEPKALLWTDFPDTEEDLFGPNTREDMREPAPVRRRRPKHRRQSLYNRLSEGEAR